MAEKARFFQNHRAVGFIMPSPDPRAYTCLDRGVRNVDSVILVTGSGKTPSLLEITQNPAIKQHL